MNGMYVDDVISVIVESVAVSVVGGVGLLDITSDDVGDSGVQDAITISAHMVNMALMNSLKRIITKLSSLPVPHKNFGQINKAAKIHKGDILPCRHSPKL